MNAIKKILIIILILAAFGGAAYFFYYETQNQEKKIAKLNSQIENLKQENVPVRYKVTERQDGRTKVKVKFYDLEGKEVGQKDFDLEGNQVSFDFYVVKFDNGFVAFPWKIFTEKMEAKNGLLLFNDYSKNEFPEIYFSKDNQKPFNDGIKALYSEIKEGNIQKYDNIFGSMVQNTDADVAKNRDVDVWYKIIVHTKGGLEIIKD